MYDVITVGAAVRDVYVQSDQFRVTDVELEPGSQSACFVLGDKIEIDKPIFGSGGGATNAAATFAHLGLNTACIAKIGQDAPGNDVLKDLSSHGVHTNLMVEDTKLTTGYSVLLTTGSGQRTAIVYRGASSKLDTNDLDWKRLKASWMYVTNLAGNIELLTHLFDHAIRQNMHVTWNPGSQELSKGMSILGPLIKRVTVLSLNREEALALTGATHNDMRELLRSCCDLGPRVTIITDGKNGTYAVEQDRKAWRALPSNVPVVNATGSGDAFGSGFTAGLLEWDTVVNALQLGTLNAEAVIQKVGAKYGLLPRMPGSRQLGSIAVEPFNI